jgi:hypothetical protein
MLEMDLLHKFKIGDVVFETIRPQQFMLVTGRKGVIYSCAPIESRKCHDLTFIERELKGKIIK